MEEFYEQIKKDYPESEECVKILEETGALTPVSEAPVRKMLNAKACREWFETAARYADSPDFDMILNDMAQICARGTAYETFAAALEKDGITKACDSLLELCENAAPVTDGGMAEDVHTEDAAQNEDADDGMVRRDALDGGVTRGSDMTPDGRMTPDEKFLDESTGFMLSFMQSRTRGAAYGEEIKTAKQNLDTALRIKEIITALTDRIGVLEKNTAAQRDFIEMQRKHIAEQNGITAYQKEKIAEYEKREEEFRHRFEKLEGSIAGINLFRTQMTRISAKEDD